MMKKNIFIPTLIILLLSCGGTGVSDRKGNMDWKIFRGDPELSGYTEIRLPEKPVLLWTFKSETRTVSSPIVNNGTTYWSDRRGRVLGVDINGNQVFKFDMQTAVEATPMIYDTMLYIGRIDGFLYAISLSRQEMIWKYETMGQISASPNIVDFAGRKAIVFGTYDNYLYIVDANKGTLINRFESGYYINGAVALHNKNVIFGGCDGWLRIIDCETGISADSLELENYIPASPAIKGDFCYVGDHSGNIYEIQLKNGKVIHNQKIVTVKNDTGTFTSVPVVCPKNLYYLFDRYIYSINRKDRKENWKYMLKGNVGESSPVVCHDKIIVCTKTGIVSILDAEKGDLLWEYDTGEQIVGSPAVIKDHFFILTAKGTLFCFGNKK